MLSSKTPHPDILSPKPRAKWVFSGEKALFGYDSVTTYYIGKVWPILLNGVLLFMGEIGHKRRLQSVGPFTNIESAKLALENMYKARMKVAAAAEKRVK